jgi:hypothetical protein
MSLNEQKTISRYCPFKAIYISGKKTLKPERILSVVNHVKSHQIHIPLTCNMQKFIQWRIASSALIAVLLLIPLVI